MLTSKKALTKISSKYSNYVDIFLVKLKIKLPKHNNFNDYFNKLLKDKQPVYRLIYSFNLVKLKNLRFISKLYTFELEVLSNILPLCQLLKMK